MASASFSPNTSNRQRISLAQIDSVVTALLGPTRGLGKSQPACFNRQVAMYLASHLGRWSTTVIGRFYGGRDHSTVVHSIQRIEAMREIEPDLDGLLCDLKSKIGAGADCASECAKPRLVMRSPTPREREMRILASDIVSQVRELVREEIRSMQEAREFGGGSGE